jgi:ribosome-associated heat shock protein Hsp15
VRAAAEVTRVDRWLWAVRLFRTRSAAAEACRAGHVQVNDARAKPAAPVRVGDRIRVRGGGHERVVEVARVIEARVGAPAAAECLVDHSPPRPPTAVRPVHAERPRGAGRPTKRERRELDRLRGRRT